MKRLLLRGYGEIPIKINPIGEQDAADEKWTKMINGMKIYTSKQLVAALKEAGFTEIKTYSNAKNHWISIVATK